LTDWFGTGISVFPNTALTAVCLSAAIFLALSPSRLAGAFIRVLGVFGILVGAVNLYQHVTGVNLGIDTIVLIPQWGEKAATAPGRMGPPASASFLMLGAALCCMSGSRTRRFVPMLSLGVLALVSLGLTGYLFRADPLFAAAKYTGISLPTGTMLFSLSLAMLGLVPELEPVRILRQRGAAGVLARRSIVFAVLVPLTLGRMFVAGREAGWFDRGMGVALLVLVMIALSFFLLWWCVRDIAWHEEASHKELAERKRAEQELARINRELEARVEERTASLKQALAQMEEFSYSVSHDLRAPARAMQGFAQTLLEDHGKSLDESGRKHLDIIISSAQRMDRLIQDILAYSRVGRNEAAFRTVELDSFVRELIKQSPELVTRQAQIQIEGKLPDVLGHSSSIGQVVSNLLNNAAKFVKPGVQPAVKIRAERFNGTARIWFEDNGIGIRPTHQNKLFGLFARVHTDGDYEGTGIGLAIVRKAVDKMGGRVGVESDGVTGSKFWIELPAAEHTAQS